MTRGDQGFNTTRFPRLTEYIRSLPSGLSSYPQCKVRGSMMIFFRETMKFAPEPGELPAEIQSLLDSPPLATTWIDEVRTVGLQIALRDDVFLSDAAWLNYVREVNRSVTSSTMYSVILSSNEAQKALRNLTDHWKQFHTGSFFRLVSIDDTARTARLTLSHPRGLFPPLRVRGFGVVVQVCLDIAGAKNANVQFDEISPEQARFTVSW